MALAACVHLSRRDTLHHPPVATLRSCGGSRRPGDDRSCVSDGRSARRLRRRLRDRARRHPPRRQTRNECSRPDARQGARGRGALLPAMIAPARRAAIDALAVIDAGDLDMGSAIARARAGLLDQRDRALLFEIVTGTLRMQAAIDYQLAARVKRPIVKLDAAVLRVLRMSAFQLIYLSR